jgi:hypothetical protein
MAGNPTPEVVYRGITQGEHDYIKTHGHVLSDQRYCVSGEGTCFASDHDSAESYVNYGHTNPLSTKQHTYVLGVKHGPDIHQDPRDGYWKASSSIPANRIVSVHRYNPDGTFELGNWHPQHGFISAGAAPQPHPSRQSPAQWGIRKSESLEKHDTPEFRQWFQGSKVATPEGKPLHVYHGTSKDADFSKFKIGKRGAWFTANATEASKYAMENDSQGVRMVAPGKYERTNTASRVLPAHLSIRNPYKMTQGDLDAHAAAPDYAQHQAQFFDGLRAAGHDGVDFGNGTWVAFHPHQIKTIFNSRPTANPAMHKSEQHLEKMAIANIAPGKRMPGGEFTGEARFDYSHVLPAEHQGTYQIHVVHKPEDGEWQAHLMHQVPGFAPMKIGSLDSEVEGNGIAIGFARIGKDDNDYRHRGKGLGPAMYEALLAHAKHHLKLKHVVGNVHSSMASSVHRQLAAKHGMDYDPKPNYKGFEGGKKEWAATPAGPFDRKYGPYFYAIKSEAPELPAAGAPATKTPGHLKDFLRTAVPALVQELRTGQAQDHDLWNDEGFMSQADDSVLNILDAPHNLQEGSMEKSLKEKFMAVAAAGAMVASPAAAQNPDHLPDTAYNQPHAAEWKPHGLNREMYPIAHLESNFGKRLEHLPHSQGEFHSSFGAVGLKPVTAHETYIKSKALQKLFPGLHEPNRFIRTFKDDPVFYNTVASTHWNQLKKLSGGDTGKTAFAWRWGAGKMARTPPELIAADPYVQAFRKITERLTPQPASLTKGAFEKAVGQWLHKAVVQSSPNGFNLMEEDRATADTGMALMDAFGLKQPDVLNTKHGQYRLYDMAEDEFNLFQPRPRQTAYGLVYEPMDLESIKTQLMQLGYHGYRGRSADPDTFVFFADPAPVPAGGANA